MRVLFFNWTKTKLYLTLGKVMITKKIKDGFKSISQSNPLKALTLVEKIKTEKKDTAQQLHVWRSKKTMGKSSERSIFICSYFIIRNPVQKSH